MTTLVEDASKQGLSALAAAALAVVLGLASQLPTQGTSTRRLWGLALSSCARGSPDDVERAVARSYSILERVQGGSRGHLPAGENRAVAPLPALVIAQAWCCAVASARHRAVPESWVSFAHSTSELFLALPRATQLHLAGLSLHRGRPSCALRADSMPRPWNLANPTAALRCLVSCACRWRCRRIAGLDLPTSPLPLASVTPALCDMIAALVGLRLAGAVCGLRGNEEASKLHKEILRFCRRLAGEPSVARFSCGATLVAIEAALGSLLSGNALRKATSWLRDAADRCDYTVDEGGGGSTGARVIFA